MMISPAASLLGLFFIPEIHPAVLELEVDKLSSATGHDQVFTLVIEADACDFAKQDARAALSDKLRFLGANEVKKHAAFKSANSQDVVVASTLLQSESTRNSHVITNVHRSGWRRQRDLGVELALFHGPILAHENSGNGMSPAEVGSLIRATGSESNFRMSTSDDLLSQTRDGNLLLLSFLIEVLSQLLDMSVLTTGIMHIECVFKIKLNVRNISDIIA